MTSRAPKRPRPHIPLATRCNVAALQLWPTHVTFFAEFSREDGESLAALLERRLIALATVLGCEPADLDLDHNPPLRARPYNPRIKDPAARYTPNANDLHHLEYRPRAAEHERSHRIKTNVRGDHGQHSDRVLIKRERRRERQASGRTKPKVKIRSRGFQKGGMFRWPKRPMKRK